ncbi:MAG: hypothetical protein EA401_14330 [Planctomycetota bacterium]|nr:MAG: hypothetical protein EA401_14330 [Planctomycetota bacterium]
MPTPLLLAAIDAAQQGNWDQAHELVQALRSPEACWIHAALHRIEGDLSNAAYWYSKAGRAMEHGDIQEELSRIRHHITA